ncbi:MAG: 23S rRNA (uracil(1939)-C(5))-methyltransferase RlmD, partial [Turicibacter sp.]|nr:23S rRNA (uracil(1939)-C(5))-methyltransferase RlmD [Turicibacter sp.]
MKPKIPVEMDKTYELKIERLTHDGLGIARVSGFLVFVHDALPGEVVRAKITGIKKKYAHAIATQHLEKSEARITPACPIFAKCGGCQIQHLDYRAQLEFKRDLVASNLRKIAKLEHPLVAPTIGMATPYRYRNKTQVPFARCDGKIIAGFYENRSHHIIDMDACLVQTEVADAIIAHMKQLCGQLNIEPYNERSHTGVLRHVIVRTGFNTDEIMVILVTTACELPNQELLIQRLRAEFGRIVSIAHNINPDQTNVIFGKETRIIYGKPYLKDSLDGLDFLISPRSFYQVNPIQTEIMYQKVIEFAALAPTDVV